MQGCFLSLLCLGLFLFVVLSLIRWFEQTVIAVEERRWDRITLLVLFPFAAWFYPSRVVAGRPIPVPRHEPVRGRGTAPKERTEAQATEPAEMPPTRTRTTTTLSKPEDLPPPGTPPEFLGMPVIPPKPKRASNIDPDKVEQLRKKMRDQGML